MSTSTIHPLAADYLKRLRHASRRLSSARRKELLTDIESHLSEAIDPDASDAEVLTVIDRLGEPEEVVSAAQPRKHGSTDARGAQEWTAIILLLFGGFIFGVGWIVGLVLLWSSRAWTTREKWIGTLVIPGGLTTAFYALTISLLGSSQLCTGSTSATMRCTGGSSTAGDVLLIAGMVILALAPIASAIYLARRAG